MTKLIYDSGETMHLRAIGGSDVSYEYHEAFKGFRENKKHPEICKVSNTPVKNKQTWLFPFNSIDREKGIT